MKKFITDTAIAKRIYWIEKIRKLAGNFSENTYEIEQYLANEIQQQGVQSLLDHLHLCGHIPEIYGHDSSEEKLYSKYTDSLLSESFKIIGLKSIVLKERSDVADVEVFAKNYSFIADAKSCRISRTAKNQKDFKVQAMDIWKRGKPYAMVICPIYQLPNRSSQIYAQAITRNVCIFTYSHLAMLVSFSQIAGQMNAENLLHEIFKIIPCLNPSKDASNYWLTLNKTMLEYSLTIEKLWETEKCLASESIEVAKEDALTFLAQERNKIMRMNYEETILELIKVYKIETKIKTICSITNNGILEIR